MTQTINKAPTTAPGGGGGTTTTNPLNDKKTLKEIHIAAILNVCRRGDYEFLESFVKADGDLMAICDDQKRNCLIYSTEGDETNNNCAEEFVGGRLKCAEILLKNYPKMARMHDANGMTVVHHCIAHDNFPFLKLLKAHGVDLSVETQKTEKSTKVNSVHNRNIIHLSVIYTKDGLLEKIFNSLIAKTDSGRQVDVNLRDSNEITPLHYAVQQQSEAVSIKLIKTLVKAGKANLEVVDAHDRTPFIWAMTVGNVEAVRILLRLGANYRHKDKSGISGLHCAASRGFTKCVMELASVLKRKQDILRELCNLEDLDGCTPLFYSITMGNHMVSEKLLEYGANVKRRDKRLRTVLHCATRPQDSIIVIKQFQMLMKAGVEVWSKSVVGESALHEACSLGNEHFVGEMVKVKSAPEHIDDKTYDGKTAIMIAVEGLVNNCDNDGLAKNYLKIIEYLLRENCDLKTSVKVLKTANNNAQEIVNITALDQLYSREEDDVNLEMARKMIRDCGGKTFEDYATTSQTFKELSDISESQQLPEGEDKTLSFEDNAILDLHGDRKQSQTELEGKATKDASTYDMFNDEEQSSVTQSEIKNHVGSQAGQLTNENVDSIKNSSSYLTDKSANTSLIDKINIGIQPSESKGPGVVGRLKSGRTRQWTRTNDPGNPYLEPLLPQSAMANRSRRFGSTLRQNAIEPFKDPSLEFIDKTIFCYCQCRHGNIHECQMTNSTNNNSNNNSKANSKIDDLTINRYMAKRMNLNDEDLQFLRMAGIATERYTNALKPYRRLLYEDRQASLGGQLRKNLRSAPIGNNKTSNPQPRGGHLSGQKKSLSMSQRGGPSQNDSGDGGESVASRSYSGRVRKTRAQSTSGGESYQDSEEGSQSTRMSRADSAQRRPWRL